MVGTDQAGGKASQLVGMFSIELAVGKVHVYKMPQAPSSGDIDSWGGRLPTKSAR